MDEQQPPTSPISERRGALIVTALACAAALVLSYGGGIGVVPAGVGPQDGGNGEAARGDDDGMDGRDAIQVPPASDVDDARPDPAAFGPSDEDTAPADSAGDAARRVLPSIIPPATPPSTTPPPSSSPSPSTTEPPATSPPTTSPGTPSPPTTEPPPTCTRLVSDLLEGLVGHLSGPNVDAALVQQVSDVLGLESQLSLGSLLGLVSDLRSRLGIDVTGVVTVTAGELSDLLDLVLRGCRT